MRLSNKQNKTPVLLLHYNRSQFIEPQLRVLEHCAFSKVYLHLDGTKSRKNKIEQLKIVSKFYSFCKSTYNYEIQIEPHNLGLRESVISAIDHFFSENEKGIILEDDCIPSSQFIPFANKMLSHYEDKKEVANICGTTYHNYPGQKESYHFSKFITVWGWATWRDRWKNAHPKKTISKRGTKEWFQHLSVNPIVQRYFKTLDSSLKNGKLNSWALPYLMNTIRLRKLNVVPKVNLVSNFGYIGTHASNRTSSHSLQIKSLDENIIHPSQINRDTLKDERMLMSKFSPNPKSIVSKYTKKIAEKFELIY